VQFGSLLVTFWDNISGQSSRVRVSKNNTRNMYIPTYIGNGVGIEWFSDNVVLADRVSGYLFL
jgi:hypothetical protein